MTNSLNFSLPVAGVAFADMALGPGTGLAWDAGAAMLGAAAAALGAAAAALGAGLLLLGFVGRPAACLHPSDRASLCSLRQATIRPPPGCTPAHSFCASPAQAARIAASVG